MTDRVQDAIVRTNQRALPGTGAPVPGFVLVRSGLHVWAVVFGAHRAGLCQHSAVAEATLKRIARISAHELAKRSPATWPSGKAGSVTAILWIAAITLIVIGVAGTILPALPGAILVFAGIVLAAWIDDFARIPMWLLVLLGVLTAMAWTVDYIAAVVGAKRAGASRQAMIGASIGTLAGIFSGLWGLLFMPLVGAVIGEYLAQRDVRRAGKVGIATWFGLLLGTAAKVAIVFAMVGIFVFALLA